MEITSPKNNPAGLHGEFDVEGGSFSSGSLHGALFYSIGANRFSVSGNGFHTDRYLDPPVLGNYTNLGNSGGFTLSYEHDFMNGDRIFAKFTQQALRYLVPNELVQEQAGQRQDAAQKETGGQIHYTHAFSTDLFLSLAASVRDASALLSSMPNPLPSSSSRIVATGRGTPEPTLPGTTAGTTGKLVLMGYSTRFAKACNTRLLIRPNSILILLCNFSLPITVGTPSHPHMLGTRLPSENGTSAPGCGSIDNLKDSSFRFGCGVGTLIENPPHVAVALRGPVVVVHTRALVVTGTCTHPRG